MTDDSQKWHYVQLGSGILITITVFPPKSIGLICNLSKLNRLTRFTKHLNISYFAITTFHFVLSNFWLNVRQVKTPQCRHSEIWHSFLWHFNVLFSCDQAALWMVFSVRLSVCPSVCPSVTPFWLCYHHRIIMKFSGVITLDQGKVHAKGQGQRSKVKVTEVTTQIFVSGL